MPLPSGIEKLLSRSNSGRTIIKISKKADKQRKKQNGSGSSRSSSKKRSSSNNRSGSSRSSSNKTSSSNRSNQNNNFNPPPPPDNTVFDIIGSSNNIISKNTQKAIEQSNINSKEVEKRVKENTSRGPKGFTFATSRISATPKMVEDELKQFDKVTKFVTEKSVQGFGLSMAAAGSMAAAPVVAGALPSSIAGSSAAATVVKTGAGIGASIMAPGIAKEIQKQSKIITNRSDYDRVNTKTFNNAINYAKNQHQKKIGSSATPVDDIGSWIPGISQMVQDSDMRKYVTQYYVNQGYNRGTAKHMGDLAAESNFAEGIGDVIGTVGIESAAEFMGQKMSGKVFQKVSGSQAKRITKSALLSLPFAGFFEGTAEYTKERLKNQKDIKLYETNQLGPIPLPGGLLGSGAFGSIFATALGGTIAGTSVKRPKTSKGLLTAARIIDPYEYPGDVLGGWISRRGKTPVLSPLSNAQSMNNMVQSMINNQASPTSKKNISTNNLQNWFNSSDNPIANVLNHIQNTINNTPSNIPSSIPSNTPVPSPTPTPSNTPNKTPNPDPVPGPNIPNFDPSPDSTPNPDPDPTDPQPTITPSPVINPVPTPSPIMRVTPPLFPFAAKSDEMGGSMGIAADGRKYYDERMAALKTLMKVM